MLSCLSLALALALPAADDPKAVVEKAIKAHGGADLLNKFPAERVTVKGTVSVAGMDVEASGTGVARYPDRLKSTAALTVMGMELKIVRLVTPDTVAVTVNGMPAPLTDEQKADERLDVYADSLTRLVPLLKGDEYTLKAGPAAAVGGDPAVAVVVEHANRKPVTLYFDTASGRLVRTAYTATNDGAEVEKETTYSDYKAVQGVQVAHRQVSTKGGKKEADITLEKVELLEKVDDSEFAAD